jgi:nitronate monooxygenase
MNEEASLGTNGFLEKLGIRHPIVLAPMGAGPGTPELAAAVSNAGGFGAVAAAYLTPDKITEAVQRTRALTDRPFSVNLFVGASEERAVDPGPMLELLGEIHKELGLPPPAVPAPRTDPFPDQFQAVLEARPAAFSFTFGIPDASALRSLRSRGIAILGTATTIEEGRLLMEAGVDAIMAQGAEAGAHRGTFAASFEASMVPTVDLVRGIAPFAPVIASGGIMDGRDLALMLANGAVAAQLGTAFLRCPESGASSAYKRAIQMAASDTTVITRAFSGRPARGLVNAFITALNGKEHTILPYPLQNALTRPMRTAAGVRGNAGFLSLWAGQGVARSREMPAADLVSKLVEEAAAAPR